jgi:uncharacterized membrane protein YqaE (UPF0057 family)
MKKLSVAIILVVCSTLLLPSCKRLSDVSITKRHYRSGFYVDLGGSHKQNKTKHQAAATASTEAKTTATTITAPIVTAPAATEPLIAATTPPASDKIKDNSAVAAEKTTSELSPVLASATAAKKKKHEVKKVSDNVYASSENKTSLTAEIQEALLKYSIASNASKENNIISSSAADSSASVPMWLMIVFAIILPPLAIGLKFGIIDKFWISCVLTLLFWIPGVIYAIYWVTK